MKKILLLMVAALFLCGVTSAQNWGTPDSHAKSSNTPIVAKVTLGETVQEAGTLGAFVGTELRGLATIHTDGNFWIQAFYNEGETNPDEFTFKFYDGEQEYTNCTTTLTGQEEGYGTPNSPVELVFAVEQTMTQTSTLAAGWTWWSTPIEMNGNNGLEQLENCLGSNGIMIKSKESYAQYMSFMNQWVGNISITNEEGYKIDVTNSCPLSVTGVLASPEDHPITLSYQWNWIGYPVNQTQNISSALGDFVPSVNDILKSQEGYAQYFPGIGWQPSSFTLSPGNGYLYYSNSTNNKTLVFSNTRAQVTPIAESIVKHWNSNVHGYADNMCLMAIIKINGEEQRTDEIELGAFVDGECRGSGRAFYIESLDRYYVMMTISGQKGDDISFKCINTNDSFLSIESDTRIAFTENGIVGEYNQPYPVEFASQNNTAQIVLFPNPVNRNESFTVMIPDDEVISEVIFVDAQGNMIRHDVGLSHPLLSGIPVIGLYNITIICKSGTVYHGRVIVK